MSTALEDIAAERERQKNEEWFTEENDDLHVDGELAKAAACYAAPEITKSADPTLLKVWPWDVSWWKPTPKNIRRRLVKAGALIVAEIERLDRAAAKAGKP